MYSTTALLGLIALRQGDHTAARTACMKAVRLCDEWLVNNPQSFEALDAKGLALAGLALCGDIDALEESKTAYRSARNIAPHSALPGYIDTEVLVYFDALSPVDSDGALTSVRDSARGMSQFGIFKIPPDFSEDFAFMFDRLVKNPLGEKHDFLRLYLSEFISLQEAVTLEQSFDRLFKQTARVTPEFLEHLEETSFDFNSPFAQVRLFSHPGSTELIFAATVDLLTDIDPFILGVVTELACNALWDGIKMYGNRLIKFGIRLKEGEQSKSEILSTESPQSTTTQREAHLVPALKIIEELEQKQRYVGFSDRKLVFGFEKRTRRYELVEPPDRL